MPEMFFQVLFIIVICLGMFLFASWFFSCLYTEWQLDAAERARKKQEEELQVVKEQDPDGTEETNFIEETSIAIDDHQPDKKNKKQSYNVQMSDATLPSNQVLCSVYSQGSDSTSNNSKKKKASSQKQQQQNQQQQFANLTLQDIQVHQLKQQQAAQQRQIEQIKQQYPNLTASDIRHLQQIQQAQQLQANLNGVNNLNNSTSNNVSINLSNSVSNNKQNVVNNTNNNQQATAVEIPATVEIVIEPEKPNPIINPIINKSQNDQQKATETIIAEVEKNIIPETVQQTQTQQSITMNTINQQKSSSNQQPIVSVISEEEIIKELNLQDKLPYRERKLEEYEFFKTTLEIIDLSHNLEPEEATDSYVVQFENAINQADARKSKINWQEVPLLHATDHITAIEELAVLLDHFLKSKFFKKINRPDKMKVIDQLLRSVLNIITKRIKYPAKKVDHQEDILWIFSEIKENLENEKARINKPKSSNQNINKPTPPPKPTQLSGFR